MATKNNVSAVMIAQTQITKLSRDGGSTKLGVTPLGETPAGIWDSGTPAGNSADIIAERSATMEQVKSKTSPSFEQLDSTICGQEAWIRRLHA